jgi:DNA (cytosine-5)-methyltransferase 1
MLTHLDLFSGIGGFALAAEWAGFTTIGFVEIDKYCQKVLRKHWPDVPIVEDIRDVERIKAVFQDVSHSTGEGCVAKQSQTGISGEAVRETSTGQLGRADRIYGDKPITLITGGFPCQPFSVAGKRGGKGDDRYLWPEMLRVIEEARPHWVLGENVAGIVRMELDTVLSDLEGIGYTTQAFVVPACAVNAPHRRDRVWIVAHSKGRQNNRRERRNLVKTQYGRQGSNTTIISSGQDVANPSNNRCPRPRLSIPKRRPQQENPDIGGESQDASQSECQGQQIHQGGKAHEILDGPTMPARNCGQIRTGEYWRVEPELGRVAHGIPNRVERLKCLGNAIVPQVAYQILKVIAEIETGQI